MGVKMDETIWGLAGFIESSNYRKKILLVVSKTPLTPKVIALRTNLRASHVSNTLSELKSKGLVECLNETSKKGRLYRITAKAERILDLLDGLEWQQE
jgi:predicted transcriptional regulator